MVLCHAGPDGLSSSLGTAATAYLGLGVHTPCVEPFGTGTTVGHFCRPHAEDPEAEKGKQCKPEAPTGPSGRGLWAT